MQNPEVEEKVSNESSAGRNASASSYSSVGFRKGMGILMAFTLTSGIVHGALNGRWSESEDKTEQGRKLTTLPEQFGDWRMLEQQTLGESAQRLLQCYGSDVRSYQHQPTGAVVDALVLYGPRGPIAVHTPEVCYGGLGTEQTRQRQVETISAEDQTHQLWSVEFSRNGEANPSVEAWYAWSTGGSWTAAEHPRFWLTDDLYKIQVSGPVAQDSFDPCADFMRSWLPVLQPLIQ